MSGTVNISRDLFDHPAFKDAAFSEREAWLWIIMEAAWKPRQRRVGHLVICIERGQLAVSIRFMAEAWGWTAAKVQRYVERLKKLKMICTKADTGLTVITVCNYDKFQNCAKASDTGPIQDRYTSDTNEKKEVIREEEGSEAIASDASVDFAKQLFDRGVAFLSRHGCADRKARSVIGKWRKAYQDTDIFDAFSACSKQGVIDPVPWITARLGGKGKINGDRSDRSKSRMDAFVSGAGSASGMDRRPHRDPSQPLLAGGRPSGTDGGARPRLGGCAGRVSEGSDPGGLPEAHADQQKKADAGGNLSALGGSHAEAAPCFTGYAGTSAAREMQPGSGGEDHAGSRIPAQAVWR